MAFDVQKFSAAIGRYGGLQKPSRFSAAVYPKFSGDQMRHMEFLCEGADFPGIAIVKSSSRPLGYGPVMDTPIGAVYDRVDLSIMLDADGRALKSVTGWAQRAVNFEYAPGSALEQNRLGTQPFQVSYPEEYVAEVELTSYDDGAEQVSKYVLHDAWPSYVGTVKYAWGLRDQIALLPVTLTYRSWTSTAMIGDGRREDAS